MKALRSALKPYQKRLSPMLKPLLVALGYLPTYVALTRLALVFATPFGISPWYPAAGLNVALLVALGWRYAPLVLLGTLITDLWLAEPAIPRMIIAGSVLWKIGVYTLAATLLRQATAGPTNRRRLSRPRDVLWFTVVTLIAPFFAALVPLSLLMTSGTLAPAAFNAALVQFWIGDAIGVVGLAPFLLLLLFPAVRTLSEGVRNRHCPVPELTRRDVSTFILQLGALGGAIWFAFGSAFAGRIHMYYLLFLPLVWIALDRGLSSTAGGVLALSVGCISAIGYYNYQPHSTYEIQILLLFTSIFGLILGAVVDTQQRVEKQFHTAYTFLEIANRHTRIEDFLRDIVQEVKCLTGCQAVGIRLLDEAGNIPYEAYEGFCRAFYESESPLSIERDHCMCIDVIRDETEDSLPFFTPGGSFFMNGTTRFLATVSEEEKGATRNVCNAYGFESVALVPIRNNDQVLGLIHVADRRENRVPLDVVEALEQGAAQLGANVQRLKVQGSLRRRNRELILLNRASRVFNSTLRLDEVLTKILTYVQELLDVTACSIWLQDNQTGELICQEAVTPHNGVVRGWRLPAGAGLAGWVADHQESLIVADARTDPRHDPGVDQETGLEMRAIMTTPLRTKDGVIGVVQALDQTAARFTPEDLRLLETLAASAALAIENAWLYEDAQQEIRERKRIVSALRESEGRFRRLANTAPVMIWMSEASGGCTYFNDRWLEFRGRTLEEEQGDGWVDGVHPDDLTRCLSTYRTAAKERESFSMEYRLQRADGAYRWIFDAGTPRFTSTGAFLGMIGACTDITERKEMEERLRDSEALHRITMENIMDPLFVTDDAGHFVYICANVKNRLGYTKEEIRARGNISTLIDDQLFDEEQLEAQGELSNIEREIPTKTGEVRTFLITVKRVTIREGTRLYTFHDITERKRAEAARRRTEQLFGSTFEAIPDPAILWQHQPNGEMILARYNLAARRLSKDRIESFLGMDVAEFFNQSPETATRIQKTFESGETQRVETNYILRTTGERKWLAADYVKVDADYVLNIIQDITERKNYEARIEHEGERAAALLRVASRLNRYLDRETLLEAIGEESRRALAAESASVLLYDPDREHFTLGMTTGLPDAYIPAYRPISRTVYSEYARDGVIIISDVQRASNPVRRTLPERHDIRTIVGVSIVHQDELLGVLNVHTLGSTRAFNDDEIALLQGIADQAAQALVNVRLFNEVRAGQRRLEQLSKRLVEAQETERRHIARELHDEIGQALTVLKINLQAIGAETGEEPVSQHLTDSLETVEQTLQQVRNLSLDLRPSLLDDLGLAPALRWFVDRQAQQGAFDARFTAEISRDRFPPALEIAYFRIAQEALTNVMRHAEAAHVHVTLREEGQTLTLLIQDDGQGFDVDQALDEATHGASLGLSNMRERATLLGGTLEIEAEASVGTAIRVAVPLTQTPDGIAATGEQR